MAEIITIPSWRSQPWDFFGRNDAKAETPVLWPPPAKSWLIGKDSDAGRDWGQEEKGMTKDEMAGWHHWLDGCESEWTPGVVDGQGGLVCCDSWGCKESDTTEWLNWTEVNWTEQNKLLRHGEESPLLEARPLQRWLQVLAPEALRLISSGWVRGVERVETRGLPNPLVFPFKMDWQNSLVFFYLPFSGSYICSKYHSTS